MKGQSLKGQALVTAAAGVLVRAMGFGLRLWTSRLLGAEAVGIMELAGGAQALALTVAVAGFPGAVSRLTARADAEGQRAVLTAGRRMAGATGALTAGIMALAAPLFAQWLGDARCLPALWMFVPYLLFNSLSSVYDGFFFGRGQALPPAASELTEQAARLLSLAVMAGILPRLTAAYRAAIPVLAISIGGLAGLGVILLAARGAAGRRERTEQKALRNRILRLGLPLTLNRLSHTGLKALCGVMIPLRLMAAGLSQHEAMSRLGMLNGMVLPLMLLPGLLSGALAAVGGPAMARCRTEGAQKRLAARLLLSALGFGAACAGALHFLAPLLAMRLYRLPELTPLIRLMCPLAVMLPLEQVTGGLLTGLGLQKKSLIASLLGAGATLFFTWKWTAVPLLTIAGAGRASLLGHGFTLICALIFFFCRNRKETRAAPAALSAL